MVKLLFTILVSLFLGCGEIAVSADTTCYIVDRTIQSSVDEHTKIFLGTPVGFIESKFFINEVLAPNPEMIDNAMGQGDDRNRLLTWSFIEGDTAKISCWHGGNDGFGFDLLLFKDSCNVSYTARSVQPIFKVHQTDKWASNISTSCKTFKLTLASKPNIIKGEVVSGILNLTSPDYYILSSNIQKRISVNISAFFKTVPLNTRVGDQTAKY